VITGVRVVLEAAYFQLLRDNLSRASLASKGAEVKSWKSADSCADDLAFN
jgi:hypothetical protein